MKKLTKTNIEEFANEIIAFLNKYELASYVSIYYNGKAMRSRGRWDDDYNYVPNWIAEDDVDPHDYFEWAAYDHILSMSFEGDLYDVINNRGGALLNSFNMIFNKYDLYYELGNAWNLTTYLIDDDIEVEYTKYERPKEVIDLYRHGENPSELQNIMDTWYELSKKAGDQGCCVLGAGFKFEWQGDKYFMSACSPYQGSISWEIPKDTIKGMLEAIGATNIHYNCGNMD